MHEPGRHSTDAQLLARASRLAPSDAERFAAWLATLSPLQRTELLAPLQAVLSGLVAFRQLENHAFPVAKNGLRAHLRTVHAGYRWALELVRGLAESGASGGQGPSASLISLERSLSDALRVSERLVELPALYAEDFMASFDLFLRDLAHNAFFAPADPLELTHAGELSVPKELSPDLDDFSSEAAKMTTTVALSSLLRAERLVEIADRVAPGVDGVYRAQVLLSAVRRELRTLTRFLLVQGAGSLVEDFSARLPAESSKAVQAFRQSVEAVAIGIHVQARSILDQGLPELEADGTATIHSGRFGEVAASALQMLRESAKQLRWLASDQSAQRCDKPGDIETLLRLRDEVWAFRFVLWAFADKVLADTRSGLEDFGLLDAFERHWAAFGPWLAEQTDYPQRSALLHGIAALKAPDGAEPRRLRRARQECLRFCTHLNASFEKLRKAEDLAGFPFDKHAAAARLRERLDLGAQTDPASRAARGSIRATG